MLSYADDMVIEFENPQELIKWEEERQETWQSFGLIINPKKTFYFTLNQEEDQIEAGDNIYKRSRNIKYLGFQINENLIKGEETMRKDIKEMILKRTKQAVKLSNKWRFTNNYIIR